MKKYLPPPIAPSLSSGSWGLGESGDLIGAERYNHTPGASARS
jgi:hypothetical protein